VGRFFRFQDVARASVYVGVGITAAALAWVARGGPKAALWVCPVALVHLLVVVITRTSYGQLELWRASYDRLYTPMMMLALASLWPRRRGAWWSVFTALGVAGATLMTGLLYAPEIGQRTTEQLEYSFVREQLAALEGPCSLLYVNEVNRGRMVAQPEYALRDPEGSSALPVTLPEGELPQTIPVVGECVVYVHSSLCTSPEGRPRCAAVERSLGLDELEPLASIVLPARLSHVSMAYDRERVRVAIYRFRPDFVGSAD
jgi:hypothetical protein